MNRSLLVFEIGAVFVTGIAKIIFIDFLELRFPYVVGVALFWSCYLLFRYKRDPEILKYWGFSTKHFTSTFRLLSKIGIGIVMLFILIGYMRDTLILSWHILPVLLLYPIWGVAQQFLVVGLVAGNLQDMKGAQLSRFWIIIITSLLFASVHYPSLMLILATFLLALVYTFIYLQKRQLWALGIFHGWLGGVYYYTLL